ncbi:hypothetical protein HZH68_012521 [Vespula germanica]|uniref:Uncharacterized protein n=1 Tax=Vespula germanica TaxID=30212 RepID=A0A834MYM8_VESGE|nr:hypothetical protein HZH68_012521 [Vespula germanica]
MILSSQSELTLWMNDDPLSSYSSYQRLATSWSRQIHGSSSLCVSPIMGNKSNFVWPSFTAKTTAGCLGLLLRRWIS